MILRTVFLVLIGLTLMRPCYSSSNSVPWYESQQTDIGPVDEYQLNLLATKQLPSCQKLNVEKYPPCTHLTGKESTFSFCGYKSRVFAHTNNCHLVKSAFCTLFMM